MQKLVLVFSSGDGCTYSCDNNFPFWAESKIAAELELLEIWESIRKSKFHTSKYVSDYFTFHGHKLNFWNLANNDENRKRQCEYLEPEILTLEEWFDRYCEENIPAPPEIKSSS